MPKAYTSLRQAPIVKAMWLSVLLCSGILFCAGALKAKLTIGNPLKDGIELMLIGIISALFGFLVGHWLGVNI